MKTLLILLLTATLSFAGGSDYAYKVTDVTETLKDAVIVEVRVTLQIDKVGGYSTPYVDYLDATQLKQYIGDKTTITKICEDIAAKGKKVLDSKVSVSPPLKVAYDQPTLDAIVIDPVKVDQK